MRASVKTPISSKPNVPKSLFIVMTPRVRRYIVAQKLLATAFTAWPSLPRRAAGAPAVVDVLPFDSVAAERDRVEALLRAEKGTTPPLAANGTARNEGGIPPAQQLAHM